MGRTTTERGAGAPGLDDRRSAVAGVTAAGVALALGELLAGLLDGVPSPVSAVGGLVVDHVPPAIEQVAISLFGTADKGALTVGTVVLALLAGAGIGRLSVRSFGAAAAALAAFGLLGILASLREPLVEPVLVVPVLLLAVGAGAAVLRRLHRAVEVPAARTGDAQAGPSEAGRRRFLFSVAGAGAAAVVGAAAGRFLLLRRSSVDVEEVALPEPVRAAPPVRPENRFDVAGLEPVVVPNDAFYRIDTALIVPRVDAESWRLRVTGLVERELELSLADLQAMPLVESYITLACVSNEVGGDLVDNAKWTGVPLRDVLQRAGVRSEAGQVVGRAVDGWTGGFPVEAVFDGREPLVAIGMNDEPLPREHGFPARLVVPGLYGYVSATKWLEEIELTTWEGFDGYWVPRGWAKRGPVRTQSRIDVPRDGATVPVGPLVVAGVAWAPTEGIERVEIAVDDRPWQDAELSVPLSEAAWVQWRAAVELDRGSHRIEVRATDGTGTVQTDEFRPPRPDGATGHHAIRVQARADG